MMYLLPSSHTARFPLHILFLRQTRVDEPKSLNPDWHRNRTVAPTVNLLPMRRPFLGNQGNGQTMAKNYKTSYKEFANGQYMYFSISSCFWPSPYRTIKVLKALSRIAPWICSKNICNGTFAEAWMTTLNGDPISFRDVKQRPQVDLLWQPSTMFSEESFLSTFK